MTSFRFDSIQQLHNATEARQAQRRMSAPPPPATAPGSELLVISRLQAQLLASEAEVARLRAENAQLRHEALQRAVMASAAQQQQQMQMQVQVQAQPVAVAHENSAQPLPLPDAPTTTTDVAAGAGTSNTNTSSASVNRLRASSIAGVSALCSLKRRPSPSRNARSKVDATNIACASDDGESDTHSLCLIPGCSEKSEGDRTSHLCRGHHGQLRSAASTAAAEAIANTSTTSSTNSHVSAVDADTNANKDTKKKAKSSAARGNDEKKAAPTEKAAPSLELPRVEIDFNGEKLTRTQKRLLESMMQEDARSNVNGAVGSATGGSTNRERKPRTSSSLSSKRKKTKPSPEKSSRRTRGTGNDQPTRSTKRRIIKPSQPGIGETKEGRGSDYNRIFIRQTLLETLRRIGTAVDPYGYFSFPVDPDEDDCPDYYDIVDRETEAMDLSTIESMIKDGTVKSVDELRAMLMRIVFSCRKYNRDEDNDVREEGEKILPLAEPLLDRARKSIEQQMKKSGCVGQEKGIVDKAYTSTSIKKKRQRTEGNARAAERSGGGHTKRSVTKAAETSQMRNSKQQGKHIDNDKGEHRARGSDKKNVSRPSGPTQVFDRPASDTGRGWRIIGIKRNRGKYPDHVDRYWISPMAKKKLRSRKEVDRFLAALEKTEGSEEEAFRIMRR